MQHQDGNTVLITGGNSGIGFETARMFAHAGATVVIGCRDRQRGSAAAARLNAEGARGRVHLLELDLASLTSIRDAVAHFAAHHGRLDILINNAGVMAVPRVLSGDGIEMQMAVNHFGHFALTGRLLEADLRAFPARIVTVTSLMHWGGRMRMDDLDGARSYQRWRAYRQSKLANVLFALELGRRLQARGIRTLSLACHPGYARTNLHYVAPAQRGAHFDALIHRVAHALLAQSAADGALPIVHAATAPGLEPGDCIGPSGPMELWGRPKKVRVSRAARDPELAAQLWRVSLERTGVTYPMLDAPRGSGMPKTSRVPQVV